MDRIDKLSYESGAIKRTVDTVADQTSDATPKVIGSIPVASAKVVLITALVICHEIGFSAGAVIELRALFVRTGPGNVVRPVVPSPTVIANNFSAPPPALDFIANVGTQSIDVQLTGKAGQTLHWNLELTTMVTT